MPNAAGQRKIIHLLLPLSFRMFIGLPRVMEFSRPFNVL